MKRYKLLTQDGYNYYKKGEIYEGNTHLDDSITVSRFADIYPDDWEEVETDEEIVNKLVEEFWYDEEGAKEFLEKFEVFKSKVNTDITVYQAVELISYFK